MEQYIIVKFELEGVHHYPSAPEAVGFLRSNHRHMFHLEFRIQVFTNERELEFVQVKHKLAPACAHYFATQVNGHSTSCEKIAEGVRKLAINLFPRGKIQVVAKGEKLPSYRRLVHVKVMEDGESGVQLVDQKEVAGPIIAKTSDRDPLDRIPEAVTVPTKGDKKEAKDEHEEV